MFEAPRGTRDFPPWEMDKRRYVEDKIRNTFKIYGYREIQTPTFEHLQVFTLKSGDAIIDEIYSFKDKGGRDLALRPELTAPVIRFYVEKLQMEPKPLKLFYIGNCFRYDRPQKGRYREFTQAGCELIGVDTPEAIAELIALAYNILRNIGLKNVDLHIGDLTILSTLFKKLGISDENKKEIIPLIDKEKFDELYLFMQNIGVSKDEIEWFLDVLKMDDISKLPVSDEIEEEVERLKDVFGFLRDIYSIDCKMKLSIVRGLDYYKDIVFEIEAPILGAEKQLCGGGIYELIPLFGGREAPSAGFAIGFDRAILAAETEGYRFPISTIDYYIIPLSTSLISKSIEIAQILRNKGLLVDVDLMRRGIGKALKYAGSINAKQTILLGPDELDKNAVTIRDMVTGEQKLVLIEELKNL
ncbi:MAG: histidine--tRNA ligase [Thermoplasmata archaeon]|nr:MAG: histidine--tRNA ligase [Thermoplasmata archaeon]